MTNEIVVMNLADARAYTARIKKQLSRYAQLGAETLALLKDAEELEVWKVQGYRSMAAYAVKELGMSRSNAYRVLDVRAVQKQIETVPRGTESDQLPPPVSQREAARQTAPLKQPRARRGPPSLTGWLGDRIDRIDRIEGAFEMADGDALVYLDHDQRRDLERTITKMYEFSSEWADRLSQPTQIMSRDEFESA